MKNFLFKVYQRVLLIISLASIGKVLAFLFITIFVGFGVFNIQNEYVQKSISAVFSVIFTILIFTVVYFFNIIKEAYVEWEGKNKHIVLKKFGVKLIEELLLSKHDIHFNNGIHETLTRLEGEGFALKTDNINFFPKLLAVSASVYPDNVFGVWNTIWYPVEEVVIKSNNGRYHIAKEWSTYFKNLNKSYKLHKNGYRNKRFFIMGNDLDIKSELDNAEWKYLLKQQAENKVYNLFFPTDDEFEEYFIDNDDKKYPHWRDFVIFKIRFGNSWATGKDAMDGLTKFMSRKSEIDKIEEKLINLESNINYKAKYNNKTHKFDFL